MTWLASRAEAVSGAMLRAASRKGFISLSQTGPSQRMASSTRWPGLARSRPAMARKSPIRAPGTPRSALRIHHGTALGLGRTVQPCCVARSTKGNSAAFGPTRSASAPIRAR